MLDNEHILVADGDIYQALDLCAALEQLGATIVGPASSASEALQLLKIHPSTAAIVDCEMCDDAQLIVSRLLKDRVPFVLCCTSPIPRDLAMARPGAPILLKPIRPIDVASILMAETLRVRASTPS